MWRLLPRAPRALQLRPPLAAAARPSILVRATRGPESRSCSGGSGSGGSGSGGSGNRQRSRQANFWASVQQRPFSMDVSVDTDSRCGFEVRSRVGALNVALCCMDATSARTTEKVMAVEWLELSLEDTWRNAWFPTL